MPAVRRIPIPRTSEPAGSGRQVQFPRWHSRSTSPARAFQASSSEPQSIRSPPGRRPCAHGRGRRTSSSSSSTTWGSGSSSINASSRCPRLLPVSQLVHALAQLFGGHLDVGDRQDLRLPRNAVAGSEQADGDGAAHDRTQHLGPPRETRPRSPTSADGVRAVVGLREGVLLSGRSRAPGRRGGCGRRARAASGRYWRASSFVVGELVDDACRTGRRRPTPSSSSGRSGGGLRAPPRCRRRGAATPTR